MTERIGIIDLGSNSSRLVIYEINDDESYLPVFEMKQNVRLAHNMSDSGDITRAGMARAIACTNLFQRAGTLHGVTHWVTVATAAMRQAENQAEVLDVLKRETGMTFRVLEGNEEGRYGYLGVINTLDVKDAILFDIGGASSELVLVSQRQLKGVISLPFGALNLTEMHQYLPEDEVGDRVLSFMKNQFADIEWLDDAKNVTLVGMGGTARALAKLDFWRQSDRFERVHGYPVRTDFVEQQFHLLKSMTVEKRRKIKGLSKTRADILVAGLATIQALIERTDASDIIISRNGLREGLFFEYYFRRQNKPVVDDVLQHSLENFLKVYHVSPSVSQMVTSASLTLFDALQPIHQMSDAERKLLQVTAQIESCGCYINTEKWTRHSAYIALTAHLYGLEYQQLVNVASMLTGKGTSYARQLIVLIRLAKLLTIQLAILPELMETRLESNAFHVGRASGILETVYASADADLEADFKKAFNLPLIYDDFDEHGF